MKCEDVSKELIGYLSGRADSAERREVEEHLLGCAACQKRAEELRGIWSVMDELPAVEPSFGFDARVRQRVAAEPQRNWFGWFAPQARLAFSAVLLIALTVWIVKLPSSRVPAPQATTTASTEQDFNAIQDLGVLENYDVVTKMDALSELTPAAAQVPAQPVHSGTESND